MEAARIAIGTVQFGLDYGIQNSGKVPLEEVKKILKLAQRHQIIIQNISGNPVSFSNVAPSPKSDPSKR